MPSDDYVSLPDAASHLRVSMPWLRRAIDTLGLSLTVRDRRMLLSGDHLDEIGDSGLYCDYKEQEREELHLRSRPQPYVPEGLHQYHRFHAAINDFTWLVKAVYTTQDHLRHRTAIRLDHIFQEYVRRIPDAESLRRAMSGGRDTQDAQSHACIESLKKAWYNELAFATPLLPWSLLLESRGVGRNIGRSTERFAFPSWRIVTAYYAAYHACRAIVDASGRAYRVAEHHAPLRVFKNECLQPLRGKLLRFPFDLSVDAAKDTFDLSAVLSQSPYLKFKYAAHPRPPCRSFAETAHALHDSMQAGRTVSWNPRTSGEPFMLQDLLYQFRVWSSYVDIDNMIALKSGGFRAYLDQDLHIVTFFSIAHAELAAIACIGVERVWLAAEEFIFSFVKNDEQRWPSSGLHPLNVRFHIYAHMNRLEGLGWSPPSPEPDMRIELLPRS